MTAPFGLLQQFAIGWSLQYTNKLPLRLQIPLHTCAIIQTTRRINVWWFKITTASDGDHSVARQRRTCTDDISSSPAATLALVVPDPTSVLI